MRDMTLPFEQPIKIKAVVERDFREVKVWVGQAYQNEHGYWADTFGGIFPCDSIEEAIRMVTQHAASAVERALSSGGWKVKA